MFIQKKAQIMAFIILGILSLLLLTFFFVTMNSTSRTQLTDSHESQYLHQLIKQDLDKYVDSCHLDALEEGLYLAGQRGGFLDPLVSTMFFLSSDEPFNVSIVVMNSVPPYVSPTLYPCYASNYPGLENVVDASFMGTTCYRNYSHHLDTPFTYGSFSEYQGKTLRPELCSTPQGQFQSGGFYCTCQNSFSCDHTIEEQLEDFIAAYLLECIDLRLIEELQGYEVSLQTPVVNISFNDDSVSSDLSLSLLGSSPEGEALFESYSYFSSLPIRFKLLHGLLHGNTNIVHEITGRSTRLTHHLLGLLDRDIQDIGFDIVRDGEQFFSQLGIYSVHIKRIPTPDGSVLQLTDTQSQLFGKNFSFYVARENRRPALDYLDFRVHQYEPYDLLLYVNQTFFLAPYGVDPDEDLLSYTYHGWKADYDSVFNTETGEFEISTLDENVWENSNAYLTGKDCTFQSFVEQPGRCAELTPQLEDVGNHNFTVRVCDPSGLCDEQLVRVLVEDKPHVRFVLHHIYEDVPLLFDDRFIVSLEDPSILNITPDPSTPFSFDLSYHFYDEEATPLLGVFPYSLDEDLSLLSHETFYSYDEYIQTLSSYDSLDEETSGTYLSYLDSIRELSPLFSYFTPGGYFTPGTYDSSPLSTSHTLTLDVFHDEKSSSVAIDSHREDVVVASCIPHRNEAPAYPFNTLPLAHGFSQEPYPYFANHTCCVLDPNDELSKNDPSAWKIASAGTPCFSHTDYGTAEEYLGGVKDFGFSYSDEDNDMLEDARYAGDAVLFKRELSATCDGNFGNRCGEPTQTITLFAKEELFDTCLLKGHLQNSDAVELIVLGDTRSSSKEEWESVCNRITVLSNGFDSKGIEFSCTLYTLADEQLYDDETGRYEEFFCVLPSGCNQETISKEELQSVVDDNSEFLIGDGTPVESNFKYYHSAWGVGLSYVLSHHSFEDETIPLFTVFSGTDSTGYPIDTHEKAFIEMLHDDLDSFSQAFPKSSLLFFYDAPTPYDNELAPEYAALFGEHSFVDALYYEDESMPSRVLTSQLLDYCIS